MPHVKLPIVQGSVTDEDWRLPSEALTQGWAILDLLPFPIMEVGEDYTVVRANKASDKLYGPAGGKCYQLSHSQDVPCFQTGEKCPKAEIAAGQGHVSVRHAHATKDKVELFIVSAYRLEHGGILEFHLPVEETMGRDGLTGLHTRDFFDQLVSRQRALLERLNLPYAILMMDIDHFKAVNDTYGHAAGDLVLSAYGQIFTKEGREGDATGRYGGEEFCVFMPDTDIGGAETYARRLQTAIRAASIEVGDARLSPTLSFGVWSGPATVAAADAIKAADGALYQAKAAGRDCIRIVGQK